MKKGQYDLTSGPIMSRLLLVAVPLMGTQFLQMTYNLADMFWLGRLGSDAVAAAGAVGMYLWLSVGFLIFGRVGAEIGVSQNLGRDEPGTARVFGQTSFVLSVALGCVYGAVMILFCVPLVGFFQFAEANVVAQAHTYQRIAALGMPFTFATAALGGSFSGSGNTRTLFWANMLGVAINLTLDPILIFTAGWGIAGAAIATVFAQFVVFAVLFVAIRRGKERPFAQFSVLARPVGDAVRQMLRWGVPVSLENICFPAFSMLITRMAASWGASAVAGQGIGSQIESLSWLIAGGFSTAVAAYVGQNYGAGKWTRIHRGMRLSVLAMVGWGLVCTSVMFFGAGPLFAVFLKEPEALAAGSSYMRILALCQLAVCVELAMAGGFRGMGKTLPSSVVGIVSNALRVPLAWLLMQGPLGLDGIWWGLSLGAAFRGAWMVAWYFWEKRRMPKEDAAT